MQQHCGMNAHSAPPSHGQTLLGSRAEGMPSGGASHWRRRRVGSGPDSRSPSDPRCLFGVDGTVLCVWDSSRRRSGDRRHGRSLPSTRSPKPVLAPGRPDWCVASLDRCGVSRNPSHQFERRCLPQTSYWRFTLWVTFSLNFGGQACGDGECEGTFSLAMRGVADMYGAFWRDG
jgi:hypothetical protein